MTTAHHFQTNSANSGSHSDRSRTPAPPAPSGWRHWLPFAGVGAAVLLLLTRGMGRASTLSYSYSTFLSQVQANHIKTAIIDPGGAVTGTLTSGTRYSSQIPTALGDGQLPAILKAHHVVITGAGTQTSIVAVIASLLPILLLVGLFVVFSRRAITQPRRQRNHGHRGV